MSLDSLQDSTNTLLQDIELEKIKRAKSQKSVLYFTEAFTPEYNIGWFHRELGEALDAFIEGVEKRLSPRLIIEVPPRTGKTQLVSRCFPPFILGKHPEWEVISATYGQDLADDIGRYVRNIMNDPQYHDLFPLVELDPQSNAADRIGTLARGGYKAVGVGSALTGRGAHCMERGTLVATRDRGDIAIEDLTTTDYVLTHALRWRRVQAVQCMGIQSVATYGEVTCTDDHLLYSSERTWVKAQHATEYVYVTKQSVSELRHESTRGPRASETIPPATGQVLQQSLPLGTHEAGGFDADLDRPDLSPMPGDLSPSITQDRPLQQEMRGTHPPRGDAGSEQPKLQDRRTGRCTSETISESGLPVVEGDDPQMSGVSEGPLPSDPPHRRSEDPRHLTQSDCPVHLLSHNLPQATPQREALVYDIQVEEDRSFVCRSPYIRANTAHGGRPELRYVVVHNCMIIDDPVKDREDADSERSRQRTWDWYSSTCRTRIAPGGGIIVLMTRWHAADLAGQLQERAKENPDAEQWHVITYPAIAIEDEKHRKEGEALHPERYDVKELNLIRHSIMARDWSALYQQNPTPDEGLYYSAEHVNKALYKPQDLPDNLHYYMAADLAISERAQADYTCIWPFGVDHKGVMWFLPSVYHGRLGSIDMVEKIIDLAADKKHRVMKACIEKGQISLAIGPLLAKRMQERGEFFSLDTPVPKRDKIARSRSLQGRLEQGMIRIPDIPFIHERVIPELLSFPAGKHDDINDTMTWAALMLESLVGARPSAPLPTNTLVDGSFAHMRAQSRRGRGVNKTQRHSPKTINGKDREKKKGLDSNKKRGKR